MKLTREDVLKMKEGVMLDALIAEMIMGWSKTFYKPGDRGFYWSTAEHRVSWNMFKPSDDMTSAWKAAEKLKSLGWSVNLSAQGDNLNKERDYIAIFGYPATRYQVQEKTAQLAICKAALLAILELE